MEEQKIRSAVSERYQKLFGRVDPKSKFSLITKICKKGGVLVLKYYSENDFHIEEKDKVLFAPNGTIYRDNKRVGTHDIHLARKAESWEKNFQKKSEAPAYGIVSNQLKKVVNG